MSEKVERAVAIVGVGAVLPDAPNAGAFWRNIQEGRYSITEVTPDRWDPALYYDPDPKASDKTYSKIGGWVRTWDWDPMSWRLPIPPRVSDAMDLTQIWAIVAARQALLDFGWPKKPLDGDRTAVVLGNAMAGDRHYMTALRIFLPEYTRELSAAPSFAALSPDLRVAILDEFRGRVGERIPEITEDTMPGELGNITAGRIANLFDFHGPNFITDAACASALAGMDAAVEGLEQGDYDAVLTGGVDANMGASSFVKFCKIGALSATGTRPYGEGADGFVMGEGAALFLLRRLEDAERDGDHVYAVIRGVGGSSDGRGKGITAPNPVGQRFAVQRAWKNAGSAPDTATLIEGHGTSTRVGDVVEVESISEVFSSLGLPPGSLPLGSVKSNFGHLKAAAGAAGILKAALALDGKVLPPSLNAERPNPSIDFEGSPLFVNTELQEWKASPGQVRRAGVSAFGFGGTNFHVVLEEHIPGRIRSSDSKVTYSLATPESVSEVREPKAPLRGALVVGDQSFEAIAERLRSIGEGARAGTAPPRQAPAQADLDAPHRIAIDFGDAAELAAKIERVMAALTSGEEAAWQMLANQGVHRGSGTTGQVAFLYTGQGSQYVNMLDALRRTEPIVAQTFAEADEVMAPVLGRPLSDYICVDGGDPAKMAAAEADLMQTEITQPAVLTVDIALTRLMNAYGVSPDMVMGHSLGEYGALVAAESLPFAEALEAVAGRGREMARVSVDDNGAMAAVFAPLEEIEAIVDNVDGYVVVANVNSMRQAVIGGSTAAVRQAMARLEEAGYQVVQLPVSHAFHTDIVASARGPLRELLGRLDLRSPAIPLVANVTGDFYPRGPQVESEMIDILCEQIASPVQFVEGLETLYRAGARVFVEIGPKRALHGFAEDVLGDRGDVIALFANHPKQGDVVSFNQALCGLYAVGLGAGRPSPTEAAPDVSQVAEPPVAATVSVPHRLEAAPAASRAVGVEATYSELGHLFADFLDRAYAVYEGRTTVVASPPEDRPLVVTGAGIGLPGMERVFDEDALARLLHGEQFIDAIPVKTRQEIVEHHITRLVKSDSGGGHFETIDTQADVIKLAGRGGAVDLVEDFGFPEERAVALDRTAQLAIAAGIDALHDAGIPLVLKYKTATTGAKLPERWMLPETMRDDTGVIFASAFPGLESVIDEVTRFEEDRARRARLAELKQLRNRVDGGVIAEDLDHRIHELDAEVEADGYAFDRRFLYKGLSFAHAQFAEYIGARGPNTQVNAACASTAQAVAIAEDWIRQGRCARVVIISADDVTSDRVLGLIGSGFLALGAAATDDVVEEAAIPFDRRRHGMILGMGAAAIVVESAESAATRGLQPIVEILASITANSAFHGSRLDTMHISQVMEQLVGSAERRWGIERNAIAPETVFVSHETYTPARGGSAQAEIDALRHVFADAADRIVITNTKGFTGHAMGTGIEDVLAIKAMESGVVPPVPNYREVDPELGALNLSTGGSYPVRYGLRLGAGFGSQISMTLYRALPSPLGRHPDLDQLGFEYRIVDDDRWTAWLRSVAGYDNPEVEVFKRTLRVADRGAPHAEPAPPVIVAPAPAEPMAPAVERERPAPPPPAPAATEPAEPAAAAAGSIDGDVATRVLEIVAAETGYPPDMLDLDLDLEADLGIDTVKQAEMFATIRAEWDIERDDRLALRDYPTLQHVIDFVHQRRSTPTPPPAPAATEPAADPQAGAETVPRRVPVPVLRPTLDRCLATGVTLGEGSRVVLFADQGGVGRSLHERLGARGVRVLTIDDAPEAGELVTRIDAWAGDGPVTGVYWLAALDRESSIEEMDLTEWRETLRTRVKLLYATMRHLYGRIGGAGTFLVTATRLGGKQGYDEAGPPAPLGGAVAGFTKTFKREKPDALVKVVDFPVSRKTAAIADALIDETLADPGAVEIGRTDDGRRWTIALAEQPLPLERSGLDLGPDGVFVVTGAAGSIVSAITADLAAASGGTFHLLDLVPEPDRDDPDIALFREDREALKRQIFEWLKGSGERATPAVVEREIARVERASAALAAIEAIESAGGTVHYHSVDLRDGKAMGGVTALIAALHDRVDVVLHAAGLEISRLLPDKEPGEFDLVFDVKADGWFNLLHGLATTPIGATVAFSSIAGRFGNGGQADYSAANDLLCKSILAMRTTHPQTAGIAIDWTAWGDIGMATRGSIPTVMKAAGIDMLPAAVGVPVVRRELTGAAGSREVVVAQRLGVLADEWHPTGGVDVAAITNADEPSVMIGTVKSFGIQEGMRIATTLDPSEQGFLRDHQIEGTSLLPGVMGVEAFAEAAGLPFDDLVVTAIEDVEFLAPFKFYRNEPRELTITVRYGADGEDILAHCALFGVRELATSAEPQVTRHFVGRVRLGAARPALDDMPPPPEMDGVGAQDVYRIYFHGPAYQVVDHVWRVEDGIVAGALADDLPPNHHPADMPTVTSPRLLELCFQTAGIWEIGTTGAMALPRHIDRVVLGGPLEVGPGRLEAIVRPGDGAFDAVVVNDSGRSLLEMHGYRTIQLPGALTEDQIGPLRLAMLGDG